MRELDHQLLMSGQGEEGAGSQEARTQTILGHCSPAEKTLFREWCLGGIDPTPPNLALAPAGRDPQDPAAIGF